MKMSALMQRDNQITELRELIAYVRKHVTLEVAERWDCDCDIEAGETPCPHCAANHFNALTTEDGRCAPPF